MRANNEQAKLPLTSWPRRWLEGAGAALLLVPGLMWPEISGSHDDAYHRLLPMKTVTQALAVDIIILSLLAMLLVGLLEGATRPSARSAKAVRLASALWVPWLGLLAARGVAGAIMAQFLWWQFVTPARAFVAAAGVLALLWLVWAKGYVWFVSALRFLLVLFGFCVFWIVPSLIAPSFAHQPHDQAEFRKPLSSASAQHPRIVWLLFDEMSYDQVFDHRWPGLQLPNLDRLRSGSVTFSNVQPNGYFTENVIPSLLLGDPIDDVHATADGWMLYRAKPGAPWKRFDGSRTIFADAQRAGWTTGVVGEYNPYCRLLKDELDTCWMAMLPLPDHLSRDKSTLGNVMAPLAANWDRLFDPAAVSRKPDFTPIGAIDAGADLVGDPAVDLCFVHLPAPHPPGSYNRRTGKMQAGGSYIDNLALADKILGDMLARIAASGAADRTTLILSSDHSWRVGIWRNAYGWTREDELASRHGHFDPRPMLMVRFPGETAAVEIATPVDLFAMHGMIDAMIAGQIENPQQLQSWAAQPQ